MTERKIYLMEAVSTENYHHQHVTQRITKIHSISPKSEAAAVPCPHPHHADCFRESLSATQPDINVPHWFGASLVLFSGCEQEKHGHIIVLRCVSVLYLYLDTNKPIAKMFFYVSMAFFFFHFVHIMQYCTLVLQLHINNHVNFCTLCALCV